MFQSAANFLILLKRICFLILYVFTLLQLIRSIVAKKLEIDILKSFFFSKTQSIAEISRTIGKSIPLVTKQTRDLIQRGLIEELGLRASTGGRRAANYMLSRSNLGHLVVVAIDQHLTGVCVFDIQNKTVIPVKSIALDLKNTQATYDKIHALIQQTIDSLSGKQIFAIGITMPGFVNSHSGLNHSFDARSPLHNIRKNIEKDFGVATYIENDSSGIAIAEKAFGAAKEAKDALIINLNWGVGLGMIIENQLFRGHSGAAGEFSHIPLADESRLCSCGKKGCLEVEASLLCAIEHIKTAIQQGERSSLEAIVLQNQQLSIDDMISACNHGDQVAIKAVKRIAKMLGNGIATLIHILNPEIIVISGKGPHWARSSYRKYNPLFKSFVYQD